MFHTCRLSGRLNSKPFHCKLQCPFLVYPKKKPQNEKIFKPTLTCQCQATYQESNLIIDS
jgi:hypothetical protein